MMNRAIFYSLPLVLLGPASSVLAETPAFDRPGIAFSTTTIPPGSFSFEQGLPDFEYAAEGDAKTTVYSAGTNLRIGLGEIVEIQVGTALFNQQTTEVSGVAESMQGRGDSRFAVKVALPSSSRDFSWAVLGAVTFATGEAPFSAEQRQLDFGTTLNVDYGDSTAAALYLNVTQFDGQNSIALSPSLSFTLGDSMGAYVEAGVNYTDQRPDGAVAGGGLTWMVTPVVQLDVSADFGLNAASPDVQGGFGIAVFIE